MITVTSAEKNRIEGQMKTALPFLNEQIDFKISIEEREKGRSRLKFTQDEVTYQLPIFYITPSTDDSAWEMLTDHIEEETDSQGIFIIKFNSEQHLIHNAVTYALSNHELYQKNVLSEMCRLCSYVDLEPYKFQILDTNAVKTFFETLSVKPEEKELETENSLETSHKVPVTLVKEKEMEESEKSIEQAKQVIKETKKVFEESPKIMKEPKKVMDEPKATIKAPEKVMKVEKSKPEIENPDIDLDIRALINDCFGIF